MCDFEADRSTNRMVLMWLFPSLFNGKIILQKVLNIEGTFPVMNIIAEKSFEKQFSWSLSNFISFIISLPIYLSNVIQFTIFVESILCQKFNINEKLLKRSFGLLAHAIRNMSVINVPTVHKNVKFIHFNATNKVKNVGKCATISIWQSEH